MREARRIWNEARAVPAAAGFAVHLDGRPVRLPGGAPLVLSTRPLGEAVAREWEKRPVGEVVRQEDLPLTRLAGTAQERIAPEPGVTVKALCGFAATDLLCYRAAAPEPLVRREQALWEPWLRWAAEELGASLRVTTGVMPVEQDPAPLCALWRAVEESDLPALAALGLAVPALGSLVLGLALARGQLRAADAVAAAFTDEMFQAELWGEDEIAAARRAEIAAEVALAERFLALARA
ncbi:MAG: chaperone, ATP12 [Rhodospirillales bacterium]|nr:chaperone, ATP12 [Rhodospirillales bacterium]